MQTFESKSGRAVSWRLSGTTPPSTCDEGDFYVKTDNPLGQRLGTCIAGNIWEFPASGGGGAVDSVFGRTGAVIAVANDYSWNDIASKPATFPPDSHSHPQSEVTNLVTDLSNKSAVGHGHAIADTTGLQTALDGKSATGHNHTISDTTGLQTALDGKQSTLGFTAENAANKNAVSGYAGLDTGSKLSAAQLPVPSATTLGGVKSGACTGSDKVTGIDTAGVITCGADQQGSGTFPVGGIILIISGTCPSGFVEETGLSGKFALGTLNASGDIGTTGGSDTITEVLNHTHPVTDPGHVHGELAPTSASGGALRFAVDTNASGSVAAGLDTASATTGVATSNPAGGVASIDNRPAFVKVIFCRKT